MACVNIWLHVRAQTAGASETKTPPQGEPHQEQKQDWMLRCHRPCEVGGHLAGMDWVHTEGRVTAAQYKVDLNDHLYRMTTHFSPHGSGLFQNDSAPIQRSRRVTELLKTIWILQCDLHRSQPERPLMWDLNRRVLHHSHLNNNLFGKKTLKYYSYMAAGITSISCPAFSHSVSV